MNKLISKRIKSINNAELTKYYFGLVNSLLNALDIKKDDERLSFSIPKSAADNRISLNINSRLVLSIEKNGIVGMMFEEDAYKGNPSLFKDLKQGEFLSKPSGAVFVRVPQGLDTTILKQLEKLWIQSCKDYLPEQTKSQYRMHHIPELFKIAQEPIRLESYIKGEEVPQVNYEQVVNAARLYSNAVKTTEWLTAHEGYKFKFIKWFDENIDLDKQSIETIKLKLEESQDIEFHSGFKGVNFIKSIKRYNDEFISDDDLKLILQLQEGKVELDETQSLSSGSWPKASCFLSLFLPENYVAYDAESAPAYEYLASDAEAPPKKGWKSFLFNQKLYAEVRDILKEIDFDTTPFFEYLGTENLTNYHWNWIAQDFLLYVNREIKDQNITTPEEIKMPQNSDNNSGPLNTILFGPPGTGKTYNTITKALSIIEGRPISEYTQETRTNDLERFEGFVDSGQIAFTTFHQSLSYEDFIEGIKPETLDSGEIAYNVEPGIFKSLCSIAETPNESSFEDAYNRLIQELSNIEDLKLKSPSGRAFAVKLNNKNNLTLLTGPEFKQNGTLTKDHIRQFAAGGKIKGGWHGYYGGVCDYLKSEHGYTLNAQQKTMNYVLIIDEINRGNVSAIFGELITLLEEDKRTGNKEAITVTLPYSKETFGVPNNLYLIGTMNTADRSVESLDSALRRRFSFEEMRPKPALLAEISEKATNVSGIDLVQLLTTINERIELLLDKDHQIGHSYFIGVESLENLRHAFANKVIPLLEEYFFGDFGKIGLVLGGEFIKEVKSNEKVKFASNFKYEDANLLREKAVYKFTLAEEWTAESFISIYTHTKND